MTGVRPPGQVSRGDMLVMPDVGLAEVVAVRGSAVTIRAPQPIGMQVDVPAGTIGYLAGSGQLTIIYRVDHLAAASQGGVE